MHSSDFAEFASSLRPAEPLAPHTWFRLGGPAEMLARPADVDQASALVARCRETGTPLHILAGGSNVLVRDAGVPGLVLHLESPALSDVTIQGPTVVVGSAVPLTALISQTARSGLAGLEALTGIPGTVGGAVWGNSGGRQGTVDQYVRRVTVLDPAGQPQVRERDELGFGYRESGLDASLVVSVEFELEPEDPEVVVRRMRKIWILKKENQPYGHESSGCIFKNPTPEISAGTLIDQAGLRGSRSGGAAISERHANYIVAEKGATAADVLELIDTVREKVGRQFGYELDLQLQVW